MRIKALIVSSLISASRLFGGEYHGHDDVICSDCHTTHYSERGTIPGRAESGGPFSDMLIVGSVDRLCLACHDGTDPDAPDVFAPVVMYNGSGSEFSGGGFFSASDGYYSSTSHDLGLSNQVPYSSPVKVMNLTCVSCHDPHGTSNYRNLVLNPDSLGGIISLVEGIELFENSHPQTPPERNASILAYRSGNTSYKANISEWCLDCHNGLLNANPAGGPAHFLKHPWNTAIEAPGYHTSPAHWVSGAGDGFGLITGDDLPGIPRLRFQNPQAADYNSAAQPGLASQVVCITCHFAHGSSFESSLTWPYQTSGAADLYSGCQQCHYK